MGDRASRGPSASASLPAHGYWGIRGVLTDLRAGHATAACLAAHPADRAVTMTLMTKLLERAVKLLPPNRAEYGRAMLAESAHVPDGQRAGWASGGAWFITREILTAHGPFTAGIGGCIGLLVVVDRSPSDVANQASLLVLLLSAGGLGAARPRRAAVVGLLVGGVLAAAHAIYQLAGIPLPYPMSPEGWAGVLTLCALVLPAIVAAYLGAALARANQRRSTAIQIKRPHGE